MVTIDGVLEGTRFHASEAVPWLSTRLGVIVGVGTTIFAFADRRIRSAGTIASATAAAMITWMLIADGELVATAGEVFAAQYQAAYACAAAGAAALCLGLIARVRRNESIAATVVGVCGALLFASAIANRLSLGDPFQKLPVVMPIGSWRGHADFPQQLKAGLAIPKWQPVDIFKTGRGEFTPTIAADGELEPLGWSCGNCETAMTPNDPRAYDITVRGRAGRIAFERTLRFTAIRELGNPLWPMRVGERRVFGLAHHARGHDGGWLPALATGNANHLATRAGDVKVEHARLVITVVRTEMRDGFRHFILEVTENSRVRRLAVMGEANETWLAPADGGPNVEFIHNYGRPLARGVYQCYFAKKAALPFFACSDPRGLVPGPVSGARSDQEVTSDDVIDALVPLFTIGAVVPGDKSYDEYCYEGATAGTGDAMGIDKAAAAIVTGQLDDVVTVPVIVTCPKAQ